MRVCWSTLKRESLQELGGKKGWMRRKHSGRQTNCVKSSDLKRIQLDETRSEREMGTARPHKNSMNEEVELTREGGAMRMPDQKDSGPAAWAVMKRPSGHHTRSDYVYFVSFLACSSSFSTSIC